MYVNMGDAELDGILLEILEHFPNTGYKMLGDHLNARDMRIQSKLIPFYINSLKLMDDLSFNCCQVASKHVLLFLFV